MEHKVSLAAEEWCLRELDTLMFAERNPPSWLRNKFEFSFVPLQRASLYLNLLFAHVPAFRNCFVNYYRLICMINNEKIFYDLLNTLTTRYLAVTD